MSGYNSVTQGYLGGGASGGGPATSVPISGLTAAVATNAINNADYAQGWNWDSLSLNKALSLSANSTLAAGNAQTILAVELSGANANSTQTTYAAKFSNTHTGTTSTNVAAQFTASGGTTNIAIQASGIVAITSPVVNGTGVSAGLSIVANSLTTGNGVDISTTSLRTGTVVKLTSSGTALQSTNSNVLSIISSGVNVNNGVTATGATISVTNSNVTSGTNVGLSITATGATTANYALKLVDGSQGASKVLTSDTNGNASWQTPAAPFLANRQVAFGTAGNLMTSSSQLIWDGASFTIFGDISANNGGTGVQCVSALNTSSLGDVNDNVNSNKILVDDTSQFAYYDNATHSGFFGINTSTPSVALDVFGDAKFEIQDNLSINGNNAYYKFYSSGAGNKAVFYNNDTSLNFGINLDSPAVALDVLGDIQNIGNVNIGLGSTKLILNNTVAQLGDDNNANNTHIVVDDTNNKGYFLNTGNTAQFGINTNAPTQALDVNGNIVASGTITPSDIRYKKNIMPLDNGIDVLMALRPSTYEYNQEVGGRKFSEGLHFGLIAQEVEKVIPEIVITDYKTYKSINYPELIPFLIKAIQQLQTEITELKKGNF